MRHTVVCVFAHPDDEAFGPAGTIAQLARENDVYILCATRGEAGGNDLKVKEDLAKIRERELIASSKVLGVKNVYFLDFIDGMLCNNLYHKLADKIEEKLKRLKPQIVITFEPHGVSGHIDHVAVSMTTMFAIKQISSVKEVWQHCLTKAQTDTRGEYFIFFPPGYEMSQINKVVDTSKEWKIKQKAMRMHQSQIGDVEMAIERMDQWPKKEYFLVLKVNY